MTSPQIQLELGLSVIQSYKRLSYTPLACHCRVGGQRNTVLLQQSGRTR